MIDTWFINDLKSIFIHHSIAVFIDESGDAEFLLDCVGNKYTILRADSEVEELHVKYLIEKEQSSNKKCLVYTHLNRKDLKFIREYCETNGCLEIPYLQNYIKEKVHQTLNLNINLPKEKLIAAAKVSVGKDKTYWLNLCHNGEASIFDLEKELLPFVNAPEDYDKGQRDKQIQEVFYRKVNDLLDQEYLDKPGATLAWEVVKAMLDGLAENKCNKTLLSVYMNWLDSVSFRESFNAYLKRYSIPPALDVWKMNINHPFRQVDEKWLEEIGKNLSDKSATANILPKLRQRSQSKQVQTLGILFWNDVITLLEFDSKDIAYLSSFSECVEFYKKYFYKLDTAIRNLYTEFLHKKGLLEPYQELYREHVSVFLDKWFSYFSDYKENQTGILQRIIDENKDIKTAVIAGDGVSYEIAELVATNIKGHRNLTKGAILSDYPSETENNMSRIYMDNGKIEAVHSNREKYLASQNSGIAIDYVNLADVSEDTSMPGQFLVCTYKDIDELGEKLQQKALKYFPETISFFASKISLLLANGYAKVYLISDHGFVLTGLLTEADKITVSPEGDAYTAERYIRTKKKQTTFAPYLLEAEKNYKQFGYLYFSENINPFKTPGVYGFSHGGISPQELITPCFCWEGSKKTGDTLSVVIENKADLNDVTGELFSVKIQAGKGANDLFSLQRTVYLVFFSNKTQVNKSDVFTIKCNERIIKEYTFDGHPEIEVHILDAATKLQLDRTTVKQNRDRDLGGLLV